MSVLQKASITSPFGEIDECAAFTLTNALETYTLFDVCDVGREYTLSFWIKSAAAGSLAVLGESIASSTAWSEHVIRYVAQSKNLVLDFNAAGTYYIYHAQNELGNQQTDYSEAPEDAEERLEHNIVLTAEGLLETIRSVQSDLTGTTERVTKVERTTEGITESVTAIEKGQDGIKTRLKTAEEQITPERIVQTVRSSAGYQEDRQSIIDQTDNNITLAVQDKVTQDDIDKSIEEIDTFDGSSVTIDDSGVAVKSGGTFKVKTGAGVMIETGGAFNVASEKFSVDENGEMSAVNARISGQISVDGHDVWHKGQLVVSTAQPSNPTEGMIWVKPDTSSIPAAGTWTAPALTSRPWVNPYNVALAGTSIGAAPSNATYTYTVRVPVYHTFNNTTATKVKVFLGSASGAETIAMGEKTFSAGGADVYEATVVSNTWLGNSGTIWIKVEFGDGGNMTVNSHEAISCTLTAKSTSGGTGWKNCTVQMFMG